MNPKNRILHIICILFSILLSIPSHLIAFERHNSDDIENGIIGNIELLLSNNLTKKEFYEELSWPEIEKIITYKGRQIHNKNVPYLSYGEKGTFINFPKFYNKINMSSVVNILGDSYSLRSNFVPRFYDDCTFGYYDKATLLYKSKFVNILLIFDTEQVISDFYKNNNINKYEDDPGYEKLKNFISNFDNIKYSNIKKIEFIHIE